MTVAHLIKSFTLWEFVKAHALTPLFLAIGLLFGMLISGWLMVTGYGV